MPVKSPEEYYNLLLPSITAITPDQIVRPVMPLEQAMHEGKRMVAVKTKYYDRLIKSDINKIYLDEVEGYSGAFDFSVAIYESSFNNESEHKLELDMLKNDGYQLKRTIMKSFGYIFRKDPIQLDRVKSINNGSGDLDMIKDHLSIYKFGTELRERLEKGNVDFTLIERSKELHIKLSDLIAQVAIDPKKTDESYTICLQAWTRLHEALSEIYEAGRFVFMNEPEIEELFYMDYYQKLGNMKKSIQEEQPAELIAG